MEYLIGKENTMINKLLMKFGRYFRKEERKLENKVLEVSNNLYTKYQNWDSSQAPFYE